MQGLEEFLRQQDGKFTATEEDGTKFHLYMPLANMNTGMEWGKGKVQLQEKIDEQKRLEEEANKPFARSKDDPELDDHFKGIDRWRDPMLGMVKVHIRPP